MARWSLLGISVIFISLLLCGLSLISDNVSFMLENCSRAVHDSCDGLLLFGNDQARLEREFGATPKRFANNEAVTCIARHAHPVRILLIGDSRIRQLYAEIVRLFNTSFSIEIIAGKHEDLMYHDPQVKLTVDYRWIAYVDEQLTSLIQTEIVQADVSRPEFVLVSDAVWTLRYRNATVKAFDEYVRNLTSLSPVLTKLAKLTSVLWVAQDPVSEYQLAPRRKMITNDWINRYNEAASVRFCNTRVKLWQSGREKAFDMNESIDGLHVSPVVARAQIQILMNFWCNRFFPEELNLPCSLSRSTAV